MIPLEILIVGGAGAMGQWFARFFVERGEAVYILDPRPDSRSIAEELGAAVVDRQKLSDADVVLISVPIDVAPSVIKDTAPVLKDGALLMDITSIKRSPVDAMRSAIKGRNLEGLSVHPLFGPTTEMMKKQTVIFVPVRSGRLSHWIEQTFREAGAHIEYMEADEHDRLMAVVQGLTHFVYITFGQTLRALGFDIEGSRRYMSPIYEIMTDFGGRVLHQEPRLYGLIQMNLDLGKIHETFINEACRLSEIVKEGDIERFVEEILASRRHFGDTSRSMAASDRLVNFKVKEDD